MRHLFVLGATLFVVLLGGCVSARETDSPANGAAPAPTVAALFGDQLPTPLPLPSLEATPPQRPEPTAVVENQQPELEEIVIYDDKLSTGWSLEQSATMRYNLSSVAFVDQGRFAVAASPSADYATLFFTVQKTSRRILLRNEVTGLSFRLNSGEDYIEPSQLAVSIVGSNDNPYWIKNDTSVTVEGRVTEDLPLFSETRLYFLDINNTIPPNTWVDVVVWLDELEYDPIYNYVTGFYIKSDADFRQNFYVDEVRLIVQEQS